MARSYPQIYSIALFFKFISHSWASFRGRNGAVTIFDSQLAFVVMVRFIIICFYTENTKKYTIFSTQFELKVFTTKKYVLERS